MLEVCSKFKNPYDVYAALSDDERKIVHFAWYNILDDKSIVVEMKFKKSIYPFCRFQDIQSLIPGKKVSRNVVDSVSGLLNRDDSGSGEDPTKMFFMTNFADAVFRNEVRRGDEANFVAKYLTHHEETLSFKCRTFFFPALIHSVYYLFVVDLVQNCCTIFCPDGYIGEHVCNVAIRCRQILNVYMKKSGWSATLEPLMGMDWKWDAVPCRNDLTESGVGMIMEMERWDSSIPYCHIGSNDEWGFQRERARLCAWMINHWANNLGHLLRYSLSIED